MKSKILPFSLVFIAVLLLSSSLFYWSSRKEALAPAVIAIGEGPADFGALGTDPTHWQQDLEQLALLFSAFTAIDTTKTASEQIASIPPELKVLGAGLANMRELAEEEAPKALELARLLEAQSKRPEQFLPIRALAYTHLKLLAQAQALEIDETGIAPEVKSLSEMVLAPTAP